MTQTPPYNESHLLIRLSEGDEAAFEELYRYYQPKLFLYLFPFTGKSKEITDDIIQEVFVKLWLRKETLPAIKSFHSYLFRMGRNRLADVRRQRKHISLTVETSETGISGRGEEKIYLEEYTEVAREAIKRLPAQRKKIFLLRYEEDMSLDEIADFLQIAKTTVKKQLYQGVKEVKQYLKENGEWPFVFFLIFRYLG